MIAVDDIQLTRDFRLSEFARVSHRELSALEEQRAREHAVMHLQPARRSLGRIRITSFVRTGAAIGGGTHADGSGVDIVPMDATIDQLFEWYAKNPWAFGQVIHEGDHLHVTLRGTRNKFGEVLVMTGPNQFRLGLGWAPILPALILVGAMLLVMVL